MDAQASLPGSGSQRVAMPWQAAGLQAQAAAATAAAGAAAAGSMAQSQWQSVSDANSLSVAPSRGGPVELAGGDEHPSGVAEREQSERHALEIGLAGEARGGGQGWVQGAVPASLTALWASMVSSGMWAAP